MLPLEYWIVVGVTAPVGVIRFMTGTQSVAGLTLITWSASFIFLEIMKNKTT